MKSHIFALGLPSFLFAIILCFTFPISGANPHFIKNTAADIDAGDMCVDCHEEYATGLKGTAHALAVLPHKLEMSCISCHSNAAAHVEDPKIENIGNPASMEKGGVLEVCTQCHQPHLELDNIGFDPHINEGLSCVSCHSVHKGLGGLLLDDKTEFCSHCHTAVMNQFIKTSNHPLTDNAVSCISCHDFIGKLEPAYAHGNSANCASCHPMEGGPFLYEHEATSSFSTEGEGCMACHMPHGSPNERLLTRPGNMLCRQCHGIPAGHVTAHNQEGITFDCMECHSEMHGSNDNKGLLDPNLGAKVGSGSGSCFCHNVSG